MPTTEREREALDAGGGEHEQDEGHADRDDVGVDDRPQRLGVAAGDGGRDRAPGAHLLLDALEDDDVGVGRHAQREDHARDARQRERDRDQLDEGEQAAPRRSRAPRRPRRRARGRRRPGTAASAGQARRPGDQALVERLLAERGRDLRVGDQLQVDRQRADAELLGQVLGGRGGRPPPRSGRPCGRRSPRAAPASRSSRWRRSRCRA